MRLELYYARKSRNLTQEKVAEKIGIERTLYNKIERGKIKNVPLDAALKLSKLFKKPIEKIVALSDVNEVHNDPRSKTG